MTGFLISTFDTVADQVYAVIAGPRDRHEEVRGLLAQAGWREMPVPPELRTHPQAARAWLAEERKRVAERSQAECLILDEPAQASIVTAWTKPASSSNSPVRWPRLPCSASAVAAPWPACPAGYPGAASTN